MNYPRINRRSTIITAVVGVAILAALAAVLWLSLPRTTEDRALKYVTTIAGLNGEIGEPFGVAINGDSVFVSDGQKGKIWKLTAGNLSVFAEGLDTPSGIAFDQSGNLIVADTGANAIKSIDAKGVATVLTTGCGYSRHTALEMEMMEKTPLKGPTGVAVGADNAIYFTDTYNDRVCVIEKGLVTTFAAEKASRGFMEGGVHDARFDTPTGLAVWGDKLLVADTGNNRIRVVEAHGDVWTLAGNGEGDVSNGTLLSASFVQPVALAVDNLGSIFVGDGNAIRTISGAVPTVTTISDGHRGLADGLRSKSRFNRPSGLALNSAGEVIVADSENRLVRRFSSKKDGHSITTSEIDTLRDKPSDFRNAAPARWPYDPPTAPRDIAGTLGEIRGEMTKSAEDVWFHNGLDIAGGYGETARFIRDEKVLRPIAAENFGTLRELIRMPTLGYIHIRLGRNSDGKSFDDERFLFQTDPSGKMIDVRVPRGAKFRAGEAIGTLNPMNHVHLVAGRSGSEMNALDALALPGISDSRPPVIEKVAFYDQNWLPVETSGGESRIKLTGNIRIVAKAYDQMDGNAERRRLGIYKLGYSINRKGEPAVEPNWTIRFDRMPSNEAVKFAYADKSYSGATGETIFNYIATNIVSGDEFREAFVDANALSSGLYTVTVSAADYFGNVSRKEIDFEVIK
jgi:sugar lactone lactonase YvrE